MSSVYVSLLRAIELHLDQFGTIDEEVNPTDFEVRENGLHRAIELALSSRLSNLRLTLCDF